jgi:NCS1 family nucleobase:cation symporter-1
MEGISRHCSNQLLHSLNSNCIQRYASRSAPLPYMILNSKRTGATGVLYHAPFPVLARASWGFWGSYIAIISRAILAIFWFAIQTMNGANTVRVMLGAIWPSFLTLPNHIPESQGIATNTMISFVLFWLAQVPFLYMHPNNLRWLFMVKSFLVPIAWIAILVWAFVATKGDQRSIFDQHTSISGSSYSWVYFPSSFEDPN